MRRLSVRLRATLVATVTVALALGVSAAVLAWTLRSSLEESVGEEAARRLAAATHSIAVAMDDGRLTVMHDIGRVPNPDPDVRISPSPDPSWGEGYATATGKVPVGAGTLTVQARASLRPVQDALAALRSLLLVGVPVLLLLVAVLTWTLVGRTLAPVSAIRAKFASITANDLHERVPVPETRDEVAHLARTMNATLDRLERAVERHKRFVADAAHELRSPLATLRTRLELGLRASPRLATEALADVERIQRLAEDLLLLARLDAGEPPANDEVDLGQVATEEALRRTGGRARIELDVAGDVVVRGSRTHLARMIGNLLDNAVRHAESTVTVRVAPPARVEVIDDGPGIPPEHRESVFDRFTRLDEARARDAGGSGLGLAIARDIARHHGGTLVVAGERGSCLRADLRPYRDGDEEEEKEEKNEARADR